MEQARCLPEADPGEVAGRGQQAARPQQRRELVQRHQEPDQVDQAEAALEDEAREPVVRGGEPLHRGLAR